MKLWAVALTLLSVCVYAGAQQQKSMPVKPGIVSGRVFAITEGGDLKPARMATVYLLYSYRRLGAANADAEYKDSAGHAWMENLSKAMEEFTNELRRDGDNWSDSLTCLKDLSTYQTALAQTWDWANVKHKEWQVLLADADEDGSFKITVSHPGQYTLLAQGRAGLNDAFWETDYITVNLGTTTTVKMASPKKACLAAVGH